MSIIQQLFGMKITATTRNEMYRMFGMKNFLQQRQNTTEYYGKNDGSITSAVADATGHMCLFGDSVEVREQFAKQTASEFEHVKDTLRDHGLALVPVTQACVEWESQINDRPVFCESVAGLILEDEPDKFSSVRFFTNNCPLFIHRSFIPVVLETTQFRKFLQRFYSKSYVLIKFDSPLARRLEIVAPGRFKPFQSIPAPPYDKEFKPVSPEKAMRRKRKQPEQPSAFVPFQIHRPEPQRPQVDHVYNIRMKLEIDLRYHLHSAQMIQKMIQDLEC